MANFFDKEMTRRKFLELTGKGAAGLAASSSLLSLFGITKAQAESGAVSLLATPDFVLVANKAKCTGCQRCEMNCALANDGDCHPYMSRIRVRDVVNYGSEIDANKAVGNGMFGDWTVQPETCKQCADPACLKVCPMKAIYVEEDTGVRKIDEEKCVGCGACVAACPWHMPRIDVETRKSTKCVSCGACVAGCPTSALKMVLWEDVAAAL